MKSKLVLVILSISLCASICLIIWLHSSRIQALRQRKRLDAIERRINEIYRLTRPFSYRWAGAPHPAFQAEPGHPDELWAVQSDLRELEISIGRDSRILQLQGRALLLSGSYDEAITRLRSIVLSGASNPAAELDLAISFALRGGSLGNALDYESSLERFLTLGRKNASAEIAFNTALLLVDLPAPKQAVQAFQSALSLETQPDWRREISERLESVQQGLQVREQQTLWLTSTPDLYLSHADKSYGSLELVLGTAVQSWIRDFHRSTVTRKALEVLSAQLKVTRHDYWLADVLQQPKSERTESALHFLSDAWSLNLRGEHARAEASAHQAELIFKADQNLPGQLRSRLERVYSLDRREMPLECLRALKGLQEASAIRRYVWIQAQAKLEQLTCQAETRKIDLTESRLQTFHWIEKTQYEGLRLRAMSFLTEPYANFDRRRQIWTLGRNGLQQFWSTPIAPLRGYTFYYTMASSARSAGDKLAAISLLREGIETLAPSPHQQVLALVLADLGKWEASAGLHQEARDTFSRMDYIFQHLERQETEKFWREAEISRAEAETEIGRLEESKARLSALIQGMSAPFPQFTSTARRRLLVALGNASLKMGHLDDALSYFSYSISECRRTLVRIRDRGQRDNAEHEFEGAWRGLTEVQLRRGQFSIALSTWESFRSARSSTWKANSETASRIGIPATKRLPQDMSSLIYTFLPGGLSAWLVKGDVVEQRWLDASNVDRLVQRYTSLTADPNSSQSDLSEASLALYRRLIQPFDASLPKSGTLLIDPDGPLAGIAWGGLESESHNILWERFALSQISGWAEIFSLIPDEPMKARPLIISEPAVGMDLRDQYPSLPDAAMEADQIHLWLPQARFFKGKDATLAALTANAPKSTLLHFAGHGVTYGEFGALLLAPSEPKISAGTFMTASEISGVKMNHLQLVVLAACSSGAGEQAGGINLDSLTRAFLEAGSKRVLATRWNVSSGNTTDLMLHFYDLVIHQQSPAKALQQAALEIRKQPASAHPYYWAGFQLFGNP